MIFTNKSRNHAKSFFLSGWLYFKKDSQDDAVFVGLIVKIRDFLVYNSKWGPKSWPICRRPLFLIDIHRRLL